MLINLLSGDTAKQYPHAMELNVLVIGMPNVGKSTLLNALRNMGIKGRTCLATISNFLGVILTLCQAPQKPLRLLLNQG